MTKDELIKLHQDLTSLEFLATHQTMPPSWDLPEVKDIQRVQQFIERMVQKFNQQHGQETNA